MALLAGCGTTTTDVSSDDASDVMLLTRLPHEGFGPLAQLGGTLDIDPDRGCVLLSGQPVIWPTDTTLTQNPAVLHLPGGVTAKSGDGVSGTGGEVRAADLPDTRLQIEGDVEKALACAPSSSRVIVFNSRSNMTVAPS